jgi:hypothetical protein
MSNKQVISDLTEEQKARLSEYRDKWLAIGLDTKRANRPKAEEAAKAAYEVAGLIPPTTFEWVDSPVAAIKLLTDKYGLSKSDAINSFAYGNQEAGYLSFYDYMLQVVGIKDCEKLQPLMNLAEECGWWCPFDTVAIMCEKPIRTTMMNELLHNDYMAAIEYADGYKIYALRGVVVPEWVVLTPANEMNPKDVLAITNVDVRREAMRKIGLDRLFVQLEKKTLDKATAYIDPSTNKFVMPKTAKEITEAIKSGLILNEYELVELQLSEDYSGKFLKMSNPSIEAVHVEGVPNEVTTVLEAIAFRNGEALQDLGTTKIVLPTTLS